MERLGGALARCGIVFLACGSLTAAAWPAVAAPGDVHAVTAERVNLRSGPGDDASIRSTVVRDDELIEVRREGRWLGVRVVATGEEGWIFSDLVQRRTASTLGAVASPDGTASPNGETPRRKPIAQAGFQRLSRDFDHLIGRMNEQFGYAFVSSVDQTGEGSLRVVPTEAWVYNTSREAKIYAAVALYQMWKNYHNGRPVSVSLGGGDGAAVTIEDTTDGPELGLPQVGSSR